MPRWLFPVLIAAGVGCRITQYLWDRSFWVDEASLVLNVRAKTAWELLGKLDFHQAAPPLFLLAERGAYRLMGGSEWSLRLLPLIAGCAAVVLFAGLARRVLAPWAAVIALALFCFSDRLIWHAVEAKQYGIDVFAAIALTCIAVRGSQPHCLSEPGGGKAEDLADAAEPASERTRAQTPRLVLLCMTAAFAVWFSYPAALVFAGLSLALLPGMLRRGARGFFLYVLCNLPVLISFAAMMWITRAQHSQPLTEYWAQDFVPLHHPLAIPLWLARRAFALCNYAAEPVGFLTLPCAILGAIWMIRRHEIRPLAMLVNPIGINLLAAAAMRYPFDGARVTVYLTPAVLLLGGAGAFAIVTWARRSMKRLAMVPGAAMVLIAAGMAAFHLGVPRSRGHVRPAAAFVHAHAAPDDAIYALLYREFQCYWPPDDRRVHTTLPDADRIPARRFWIVWSFPNQRVRHRLDGTLKWARSFATRRLAFTGSGGCAYLFEITTPPPHLPPPDMSTHHKMMARGNGGVGPRPENWMP